MFLLLFSAALIVVLLLGGILYQAIGSAADRRRFPPPGRRMDIGGRRLHVVESGAGSPAVILESGIAASSLNWTALQRELAKFTRVCSYDRAGLGWSDLAATPREIPALVQELHALLGAARIPPPYLLAGHSFGGLLVQVYALNYPQEVQGLLLIDPLEASDWIGISPDQRAMLQRGVRLSRRGALLSRLGVVRASLRLLSGGARRLPKLVARLSSGQGESTLSRLVGEVQKMPPEVWPMVQAHWCQPKCFLGMSGYLEALPASAGQCRALGPPPPVPVTILSAANATPRQISERDQLAARSLRGKHLRSPGWGHWVHLDQPEVVLREIREMLEAARATDSSSEAGRSPNR